MRHYCEEEDGIRSIADGNGVVVRTDVKFYLQS